MSSELWEIISDFEPNQDQVIWLAKLQEYIDNRREDIYGQNIDYAHFMERKETFHEEMRSTIKLAYIAKTLRWGDTNE
jgi:hypothetical protein